jgi:hypothetical protein
MRSTTIPAGTFNQARIVHVEEKTGVKIACHDDREALFRVVKGRYTVVEEMAD